LISIWFVPRREVRCENVIHRSGYTRNAAARSTQDEKKKGQAKKEVAMKRLHKERAKNAAKARHAKRNDTSSAPFEL
jgi:hypothetical protein